MLYDAGSIKMDTQQRLLAHMLATIKHVPDFSSSASADTDPSTDDVAASIKSICLEYFDGGAPDDATALLKKLTVDVLRLLLQGGNEYLHILRAARAVHDTACLRGLGKMSWSYQLSVLLFHLRQVLHTAPIHLRGDARILSRDELSFAPLRAARASANG